MASVRKTKKALTLEDLKLWNEITRTVEPLKRDRRNVLSGLGEKTRMDKKSGPGDDFIKTRSVFKNEKENFSNFCFSLPGSFKPDHISRNKPRDRAIPVFRPTARKSVAKVEQMDRYSTKKISKGKIAIDGQLDLHGYAQKDAYCLLYDYIEKAYHDKKKVLLIITGKGETGSGVLRTNVPKWLRQSMFSQMVSSFGEALPAHGGAGALYVRIRRKFIRVRT